MLDVRRVGPDRNTDQAFMRQLLAHLGHDRDIGFLLHFPFGSATIGARFAQAWMPVVACYKISYSDPEDSDNGHFRNHSEC